MSTNSTHVRQCSDFGVFFPILYVLVVKFTFAVVQIPDWHGDIAFRSKNLYLPPFFVWRGYVSENQNSQMTISRALDKYLKTVSIHKKGHLQEFYRVNVIKRHPIAERYMDDITTVDIANYRDQRLAQINPRTGVK